MGTKAQKRHANFGNEVVWLAMKEKSIVSFCTAISSPIILGKSILYYIILAIILILSYAFNVIQC